MSKLRLFGIDGEIAKWIGGFLNNRTQQVVVDGSKSDSATVLSGVPQGTVLGPLLFLLFINDLPSVVDPGTTVRLFADDCVLYRTIRSVNDHIQLQKDLQSLGEWCKAWGMKFNESKCNIMTITNLNEPTQWFYSLNSVVLDHVDSAKYLGVLIHKSLQFSTHIGQQVKKCNQRLGFLQRNLRRCPKPLKKLGYISMVRSCAEYASIVWDPYLAQDKKDLEGIQNRAVRWLNGYGRFERVSVTKLREKLHLPLLETRRANQRMAFMYKV